MQSNLKGGANLQIINRNPRGTFKTLWTSLMEKTFSLHLFPVSDRGSKYLRRREEEKKKGGGEEREREGKREGGGMKKEGRYHHISIVHLYVIKLNKANQCPKGHLDKSYDNEHNNNFHILTSDESSNDFLSEL